MTAQASESISLNPRDPESIIKAAAIFYDAHQGKFPKVPWLSSKGQQEAFIATADYITGAAKAAIEDRTARDTFIFWTLSYTVANVKMFRVATAAIKRDLWLTKDHTPVRTFVEWYGSEVHPAAAIAQGSAHWRD